MADFPRITELPEAPIRNQPELDYANTASVFVGALPRFRDEVNAAGEYVQETSEQVRDDRIVVTNLLSDTTSYTETSLLTMSNLRNETEQFKISASHSADRSEASALMSASNANFKGVWSELSGAATVPTSVFHGTSYWVLLRNIPNIAQDEPGVSNNWTQLAADGGASVIPPKEGHAGKGLYLSEDETHLVFGQTVEPYEVKVDDFTAEYGGIYHLDTTAKEITVTLPSEMKRGGIVRFLDPKGTWANKPPKLVGQGVQIVDDSELVLDISYFPVDLIRTSSGWIFG